MDLVIDSNILFAALLKDSGTSDILFEHKLYAPEFIFEELRKYKAIITFNGSAFDLPKLRKKLKFLQKP